MALAGLASVISALAGAAAAASRNRSSSSGSRNRSSSSGSRNRSSSSGSSYSSSGSSRSSSTARSYSLPSYDTWSNMSHDERVNALNRTGIDVGTWSNMSHDQRMSYLGGGGSTPSGGGSSGSGSGSMPSGGGGISGGKIVTAPNYSAIDKILSGQPLYHQDESGSWRVSGPSATLGGSNWGVGGNTLFLPSRENANAPLDIVSTPRGTVGVWTNPETGATSSTMPSTVPNLPPYWWQQAAPQYIQQPIDLTAQLQSVIAPYVSELQRISQGVDAETAPIISQAYDQVMGMINNAEQALIDRFTQQGQGVDPATQAALASLKETVNRQRENLMEEMSRRGLLQSGVWLEMEDRLNKGMLTQQQQLLATRLSDLQNQLNQALMNLSQARIQATSQLGTAQIQAAESAAQRRQQALSDLVKAAQEAQRQMLQQQQEAQKLAWEQYKYYYPSWTDQAQYTGVIPAAYPGDPSAIIRQAQAKWGEANAAGDQAAMDYWHQVAEQARAAAGWPSGGEAGLATESLMTQAGLPTADMTKAMLPYQYPTANALVPYQYGPTPAQMLPYQYATKNALLPWELGPTPYQQGQLQLGQSRLALSAAKAKSGGSGGGGGQPSATEAKQSNLAMLYSSINDRYRQYADQGYGGKYAADQLLSELQADMPTLLRSGLSVSDINAIKDYISSLAGFEAPKPKPWDYYYSQGQ